MQAHESGAEGCAHGAGGACGTSQEPFCSSELDGGRCEVHWPGTPWSTGLSPVYQGLAAVGPSSGVCIGRLGENRQASCGAG